jgi:hypothetical protein
MPLLQVKNPQANFSTAMTFFASVFTIKIKTQHIHSLLEPHGKNMTESHLIQQPIGIRANMYVSNWEAKHPTVAGRIAMTPRFSGLCSFFPLACCLFFFLSCAAVVLLFLFSAYRTAGIDPSARPQQAAWLPVASSSRPANQQMASLSLTACTT